VTSSVRYTNFRISCIWVLVYHALTVFVLNPMSHLRRAGHINYIVTAVGLSAVPDLRGPHDVVVVCSTRRKLRNIIYICLRSSAVREFRMRSRRGEAPMSSRITNRDKTRWRKPPALTAPRRIVQTRRPRVFSGLVPNNKNPLYIIL